jgi:hypothetical protein
MDSAARAMSICLSWTLLLAGAAQAAKFDPIVIDTSVVDSQAPVKRTVPNEFQVEIAVKKSPNEVCSVEFQREEIKTTEAVPNFIAAIVQAVAVPASIEGSCGDAQPEPAGFPLAIQVNSRLETLQLSADDVLIGAKNLQETMRTQGTLASELVNCRQADTGNRLPECGPGQEQAYKNKVTSLRTILGNTLEEPLPATDGLEIQLGHIQDLLKETQKHLPAQVDATAFFDWQTNAYSRTSCLAAKIRFIKDLRDSIGKQREPATKVLQAFEKLQVEFEKKFKLSPDKDSKLTGRLICKNFFTEVATITPVPISITYQGEPRLVVTAGLLFSTIDKRKIGTEAMRVSDTQFNVRVTEDRSSSQLVPFSFLDIRLTTLEVNSFPVQVNFGLGVGVNSNNGNRQVEYFAGPSLSAKNVHLHLGWHFGKWAEPSGGYKVDDIVPAEKFPGVPVQRRDIDKFAVGISYRLPVK